MSTIPVNADAVLRRKCRMAFQHQSEAAAKEHLRLPYTASDLFELAKASPQCRYCLAVLSFGFEFDHFTPIARTPQAHRLDNICCACPDCNRLKGGGMDGEEFTRFLRVLDGMDPRSAADIRRRLIAGSKRYATSRKRRPAG